MYTYTCQIISTFLKWIQALRFLVFSFPFVESIIGLLHEYFLLAMWGVDYVPPRQLALVSFGVYYMD